MEHLEILHGIAVPGMGWRTLEPIFWIGLLLVLGGLIAELVARLTSLPRVLGYTLAGMVAAAAGVSTPVPLWGLTRLVVDMALALLLFEVGVRVRLRWFKANPALLLTSLFETFLGAVAVFAVLRALSVDTSNALVCAVLTMPASAAIAGRIATELNAAGQVTDRMTLLTAMNTLIAVLSLVIVRPWLLETADPALTDALINLVYSFFGSLVMAGLLAVVVAVVARRLDLRSESSVLLLLGLVVMTVSAARSMGLSTLLVPLLAGIALRNTTERPWLWPRHFGTAGGVLVLMLFLVAGSVWSLEMLRIGIWFALALIVARGLAKAFSVMLFARPSGLGVRQAIALGMTLTPLSATTLVMLTDIHVDLPLVAQAITPIILSAIVMLELAGPVALKLALALARELPANAGAKRGSPS